MIAAAPVGDAAVTSNRPVGGGAAVRDRRRPLQLAVAAAVLYHGGLLASGSFRRTYDAYVHLFFADHYTRDWFSLIEPRWYGGFSVASYPPASHQLLSLVSRLLGPGFAYAVVQTAAIVLLALGVQRFGRLWVSDRAAGFSALGVVLSTAIAETVHVFGQLPTVLGLALVLHAAVPVAEWLHRGDLRALAQALALVAATAAVHHVTILFGALFFLAPVAALAMRGADADDRRPVVAVFVGRSGLFGSLSLILIGLVILPYWLWSASDPIAQVPIPHGSRDSFLFEVASALLFLVIPWGMAMLGLGYALWRGFRPGRWPLAVSLTVLVILGLGGTTPIARLVLGNAFEVLALDRFTLWAVVIASPWLGELAMRLWDNGLPGIAVESHRMIRTSRGLLLVAFVPPLVIVSSLPQFVGLQPDAVDPDPIVEFLEKDDHWQWRYLTLGMGDQMAWISANTTAGNVEGNYHSARRVPELVSSPVERLDGAKFAGVAGIETLTSLLSDPYDHGLKFVFSNDEFYDPLLHYTGWVTAGRLLNGVMVWERAGVPVPEPVSPEPATTQGIMWGTLPITALAVGLVSIGLSRQWQARHLRLTRIQETPLVRVLSDAPGPPRGEAQVSTSLAGTTHLMRGEFWALALSVAVGVGFIVVLVGPSIAERLATGPQVTAERYAAALVEGREIDAYQLLDPATRPTLADFLRDRSLETGLDRSYLVVDSILATSTSVDGSSTDVRLDLIGVGPFGETVVPIDVEIVDRAEGWVVVPPASRTDLGSTGYATRPTVSSPWVRVGLPLETEDRLRPEIQPPSVSITGAGLVVRDGVLHVVGEVLNTAGVPADVTVRATLIGFDGLELAEHAAGVMMAHQLSPDEATPFRVDFTGLASRGPGGPIALDQIAKVELSVIRTVTDRNLERSLMVSDLEFDRSGTSITATIWNIGADEVIVPRALVGVFDADGRTRWVESVFVTSSLLPTTATSVSVVLPSIGDIDLVDVPVMVRGENGVVETGSGLSVGARLPAGGGWSGFSLRLDEMGERR